MSYSCGSQTWACVRIYWGGGGGGGCENTDSWVSLPGFSHSGCLGWGQMTCLSNKFPGEAAAAGGMDTRLWELGSYSKGRIQKGKLQRNICYCWYEWMSFPVYTSTCTFSSFPSLSHFLSPPPSFLLFFCFISVSISNCQFLFLLFSLLFFLCPCLSPFLSAFLFLLSTLPWDLSQK